MGTRWIEVVIETPDDDLGPHALNLIVESMQFELAKLGVRYRFTAGTGAQTWSNQSVDFVADTGPQTTTTPPA